MGITFDCAPGTKRFTLVVGFGGGKRDLVAKAEVQSQARGGLVSVLDVSIQRPVADVAVEIASALKKHHRIGRKKAGKTVVVEEARERWDAREYEESVAGNALQGIDLVEAKASAKFRFVVAADPTQSHLKSHTCSETYCAVR